VHDIIPITNPEFFEESLILKFKETMDKIIKLSDFILTTSKSEVDLIQKYLTERLNINKKLSNFYLGCDFNEDYNFIENSGKIREQVKFFYNLNLSANIYLMVGTIEPRKGYGYALEAFENLWQNGFNGILIIVGKIGWQIELLLKKINESIYLNNKLFVFHDASDEELHYLYNHAHVLICASLREGFGLPVIEAMQYGKPVLASDISVFREIGGDYPVYFNPDKDGLIKAIKGSENLANKKEYKNKYCINWDDSADMLADKIAELIL
jgi:alpha-1,2-rhamnosyltransferase